MGWKLKMIEGIKLCPNEERELPIVLQPETRAAIHGVVKFPDGKPVKNAVVKLFRKKSGCEPCELIPVTFSFTDECGQFLFGVPPVWSLLSRYFSLNQNTNMGTSLMKRLLCSSVITGQA
jgi:hypothetical protein